MSLAVGIVGLPNVGKSTLFNALLKRQQALVANYPFATIEPNVGVVDVPDKRLAVLAGVVGTTKIVPAVVEFVDIAGLVAGAAEGAGLGNQFLAHIREVDVIVHLIRGFSEAEVVKEGSLDPVSDYKVIITELALKDLETVEKVRNAKEARVKTKENEKSLPVLARLAAGLNEGKPARELLGEEERDLVKHLQLLTAKPEIVVVNVGEGDLGRSVEVPGELAICAKLEAEVAALGEAEAREYLSHLGIKESGLDRLIKKAYETLGLISFLTAGEKEARAWTIKKGTKAPQAAGVIHTDFEKKFIKAKVVDYDDFVALGGWKKAAEAGKVRLEGKEYTMQEGDVVEFMIGS